MFVKQTTTATTVVISLDRLWHHLQTLFGGRVGDAPWGGKEERRKEGRKIGKEGGARDRELRTCRNEEQRR